MKMLYGMFLLHNKYIPLDDFVKPWENHKF